VCDANGENLLNDMPNSIQIIKHFIPGPNGGLASNKLLIIAAQNSKYVAKL
jgi:hypothetical protein